jgi:hypothetical protein
VLGSQIDVIVSSRVVRGIRGTVVPLHSSRLRGRVKLSAREARTIARRRITDANSATPAQLVAYAGGPARPRPVRRASVVAVGTDSSRSGDDAPEPVCVVVDAASGRVLETWRGSLAQPASRRPAGASAAGAGPTARAAATQVLAQYADAKGSASEALPFDGFDLVIPNATDIGSTYDNGAFFNSFGNPTPLDGIIGSVPNTNGAPGSTVIRFRRAIDLSTDAARFFCTAHHINWCGRNGMRN